MKINYNTAIQTAAIEFETSLLTGDFYLINSEIIGNNVSFYAVITSFYLSNFNMYFFYCNISNNHGTSVGAAYAALHFDGLVFFNHTIFQNNVVDSNVFIGGAVMIEYGIYYTLIYFHNCSYINNFSSQKGGVFAVVSGRMYDSNSSYINNTAFYGGTVFVHLACEYYVYNGLFLQNQGNYGGNFRLSDGCLINISNSVFTENKGVIGGCISAHGEHISLTVKMTFYKFYVE